MILLLENLDSKDLNFIEYKTDNKNSKYNILGKSAGILADQNIDPLKWQEEIRSEYEKN